jgi:hypothetical protein
MIKFALQCDKGHEFEAWFSNSASYEAQVGTRQIQCPVCGSHEVTKALMAPNVVSSRQKQKTHAAGSEPMPSEVAELFRKVRKHVVENAEYVGPRFAEEARKIHHEETEPRGIYGEASVSDVRALQDEGIDFHPLPSLPEDHN